MQINIKAQHYHKHTANFLLDVKASLLLNWIIEQIIGMFRAKKMF